jgi:4-diphosphocytidyl-2C-methyl-D-erythritol kinase
VHLAGSGPTLYSAMRNETKANDIHEKLIKMKLEAYLTDF